MNIAYRGFEIQSYRYESGEREYLVVKDDKDLAGFDKIIDCYYYIDNMLSNLPRTMEVLLQAKKQNDLTANKEVIRERLLRAIDNLKYIDQTDDEDFNKFKDQAEYSIRQALVVINKNLGKY